MFEEYLYTDASTSKNGQPGQDSTILVTNELGQIVFEKHLGDYTVNEAELLGILACLKQVAPKKKIKIFTDSQIVWRWLKTDLKYLPPKKSKATPRTKKWMVITKMMLVQSQSEVEWISRNDNLAGHVFEERGM